MGNRGLRFLLRMSKVLLNISIICFTAGFIFESIDYMDRMNAYRSAVELRQSNDESTYHMEPLGWVLLLTCTVTFQAAAVSYVLYLYLNNRCKNAASQSTPSSDADTSNQDRDTS